MGLYILRPKNTGRGSRWDPWYDKVFGFVVRAANETEARKLAASDEGDEGYEQDISPWEDPKQTTCDPLRVSGESPVIIIRDFASA